MLVHRPTDFSKAGLYAIFCTQSNDFALGYPICEFLAILQVVVVTYQLK